MKMISIPFIGKDVPAEGVPEYLRNFEKYPINILNWLNYPYRPEVEFTSAWSESAIYLYYHVMEEYILAKTKLDNGPVWKDSCVEFFVSPGTDGTYYNFEFNCIGTCLLGHGYSRDKRELAGKDVLAQIKRASSLGNQTFGEIKGNHDWELFIEIPNAAFFKHPGFTFRKGLMKANFYKCGDELTNPHYLTWSPIGTQNPDYHRPEFFGEVVLKP